MKLQTKQRALHRTKIIKGQIEGLISMIENESYCPDILTQSLAAQRALGSLNKLIADHHISTHITDAMSSGVESRQLQAQKELMDIYELNNIRSK